VLLEIALWKAFDRYPRYKDTISLPENLNRIVRLYLSGYVAHYVGNDYQSVVRTCLLGNAVSDIVDDADFQQCVYNVVIEPLKRLATKCDRD